MKIYIDVSVLTLATYVTGIQRVAREIAVRLVKAEEDEVILLHYNAKENKYHIIDNKRFCDFYYNHSGVKNKMITKKTIEYTEIGEGCIFFDLDAAWMSRVKRSWLLPIIKKQGAIIVVHIYDIISITHPQFCLERGVYNFMDYIAAHLQYADHIIVNAQETIEEMKKLDTRMGMKLPPCDVVPLGSDFSKQEEVQEHQVPGKLVSAVRGAPYILMVGTVEPRKNHKLLLDAYEGLGMTMSACNNLKSAGYNLIFAGYMGWNMEEFEKRIYQHPDFGTRLFHFSGLDDLGIRYLYQNARYLAFCSYQEGFGLPIVESILRGTPVLCVDQNVYREVGGDYPIWFEQDNPQDLCKIVAYYDANPEEYKRVKQRLQEYIPVTWDESFRCIYDSIKSCAEIS